MLFRMYHCVVESGMYYNGAIRIDPESNTPAHDVLAGDLSRSMQKDPTDYDAFSSALAESPFYKDELARRGLTPEAYRTSIEQAVKKTSGVGLPKEQAQYEAAMRFAKEVLFEDPAAIARFKQADAELFSKVKAWTERVHARLSGSSQENAASALWSMYDKADGGNGIGGSGRTDGPELPPTGDLESGNARTFDSDKGREEETAPPANEETIAHENGEGYNEEGKTDQRDIRDFETKAYNRRPKRVNPYTLIPTHEKTLSNSEFKRLIDDIKKNGIQQPVKYIEYNGKKYIVDGHHRILAAKKLGLNEVPVEKVEFPYLGYHSIEDLYW